MVTAIVLLVGVILVQNCLINLLLVVSWLLLMEVLALHGDGLVVAMVAAMGVVGHAHLIAVAGLFVYVLLLLKLLNLLLLSQPLSTQLTDLCVVQSTLFGFVKIVI